MLILTRSIKQSIYVGDDIKITVIDVQGNQLRLGISAPKEVEVHREEIYERITKEKKAGIAKPIKGKGHTRQDGDPQRYKQ